MANRQFVDEVMIARARQRMFIEEIEKKAETVVLGSTEKLEKKNEGPAGHCWWPAGRHQFAQSELQTDWRMALAFDQELNDTLPNVHRSFEGDRHRILKSVSELMVSSSKPWTDFARDQNCVEIWDEDFGKIIRVVNS